MSTTSMAMLEASRVISAPAGAVKVRSAFCPAVVMVKVVAGGSRGMAEGERGGEGKRGDFGGRGKIARRETRAGEGAGGGSGMGSEKRGGGAREARGVGGV